MWCRKCVHVNVNTKVIPVETTPETGGEGDEGE
jgi:hypothetical protein